MIEVGGFWKTVEYLGGAAVIIGCVGFAAVGTGLAGAAIIEATD